MQIRCQSIDLNAPAALQQLNSDVLAIGVFAEQSQQPWREALDQLLNPTEREALAQRLEQRRFKAKAGQCLSLDRLGSRPGSLILVGLGEPKGFDLNALRQATATACKAAAPASCLALALPHEGLPAGAAARAMAEAARLSLYSDLRFKSESEPPNSLETLVLLGFGDSLEGEVARAAALCNGVELARELVAAPPNVTTPEQLAQTAAAIANGQGLELKVLERADCEALGMGSYLCVAKGSDLPPKFIHLCYRPTGAVQRRVALVGKGLTFDSGGYNLKVAGSQIEMMKYDMGGSAAVLGAMRSIAELKPEGVEVHMIVAACENMISGAAVHPGDIVTASNGKKIEINNTDAEGRLTLADALVYACKLEPDAIVDLATLTGACVIALGEEIAGLWSNNDALAAALQRAATGAGEELWRMPLRQSYKDGLKSSVADLKNTGPRPGGSITAALFLQDFVSKDLPWAHLDIAGTVWTDKGRGQDPAGATGFGVRTLVDWVLAGAPA